MVYVGAQIIFIPESGLVFCRDDGVVFADDCLVPQYCIAEEVVVSECPQFAAHFSRTLCHDVEDFLRDAPYIAHRTQCPVYCNGPPDFFEKPDDAESV